MNKKLFLITSITMLLVTNQTQPLSSIWHALFGPKIVNGTLDFSGCNIKDVIPFPKFRGEYHEVVSLILDNNQITELPDNAFIKFSRLEKLSINDNCINKIHTDSLKGLSSLTHLYLKGNKLDALCDETFHQDLLRLTHLYLDHNLMHKIPANFLKKLEKLETFSACHNNLTLIDNNAFKGATKLEKIILAHNHLELLSSLPFIVLPRLCLLDISGNKITLSNRNALSNALPQVILEF